MEQVIDLKLNELYAMVDELVGKKVRVEGIVDHVCPSKTKLALISDDGEYTLEVQSDKEFKDYLETKRLLVKGVLKEIIVDEEFLKHKKEEIEKITNPDLKAHALENYEKLKKKVETSSEPVKKYILTAEEYHIIGCE